MRTRKTIGKNPRNRRLQRSGTRPFLMEQMEPRWLLAGYTPTLEAPMLIAFDETPILAFAGASPDLVDINGDGLPDLIVGEASTGEIWAYLNQGEIGAPVFDPTDPLIAVINEAPLAVSANFFSGATPQIVDWNNDGLLDLLVGESSGHIRIYLNTVNGWTGYSRVKLGVADFPRPDQFGMTPGSSKIDIADWNNDGKKDLIVGDDTGAVSVLLNIGTDAAPRFGTVIPVRVGNSYMQVGFGPASPVVVDWNADGKKDLIVGAADGTLYFFENLFTDADPRFGTPRLLTAEGVTINVGQYARPEIVDWDNDGILDLVVGNNDGEMYLIRASQTLPRLSIEDAIGFEPEFGLGEAEVTVSLSQASEQTITVRYTTYNGSAAAGMDYLATQGTLTFEPGVLSQTILIPILPDNAIEGDETVRILLDSPINAIIARHSAYLTIQDNDTEPVITVTDITVNESTFEDTLAKFTVRLSNPSKYTVTVEYWAVDDTAESLFDYLLDPGTLVFAPGQTEAYVYAAIAGDWMIEPAETFMLVLANPVNATLGNDQAVCTIVDDDIPFVFIDETAAVIEADDTPVEVWVYLSEPAVETVTVYWSTRSGTARENVDFIRVVNEPLVFEPGEFAKLIDLTALMLDDEIYEADEIFYIELTGGDGVIVLPYPCEVTITDNDPIPLISVEDITVTEGVRGRSGAMFTITISSPSEYPVLVRYWTTDDLLGDNPATRNDYDTAAGLATIWPGNLSTTVTVWIVGDTIEETDETFLFNLGTPSYGIIERNQAVATIQNAPPSLSITNVSIVEGHDGTRNMVFTVALSARSTEPVTVEYTTEDLEPGPFAATAGEDYEPVSGVLEFIWPDAYKTITVPILRDSVYEQNEQFRVRLFNSTVAIVDVGQALGTIVDDDATPQAAVSFNGEDISHSPPAVIDFGKTRPRRAVLRTFTIANTGTAPLKLSALALPLGFQHVEGFSGNVTLAPGQEMTFTVRLRHWRIRRFSGNITFATNDPLLPLFEISVTGVVRR